jgi:hypothetical protein
MTALLASWNGSASAKPADATADSLATAFFLLKFDTDVERARLLASSKVDSLQIAGLKDSLADAKKQRYRDMLVFGVAAAFAGVIFYLGGKAAQ